VDAGAGRRDRSARRRVERCRHERPRCRYRAIRPQGPLSLMPVTFTSEAERDVTAAWTGTTSTLRGPGGTLSVNWRYCWNALLPPLGSFRRYAAKFAGQASGAFHTTSISTRALSAWR